VQLERCSHATPATATLRVRHEPAVPALAHEAKTGVLTFACSGCDHALLGMAWHAVRE